jgi:hypothetical protein
LKRTILRLRRAFGRVLLGASMLSGVICFVMMWLIDANALSRKIFNAPVPGGVELTSRSDRVDRCPSPMWFRGEHGGVPDLALFEARTGFCICSG